MIQCQKSAPRALHITLGFLSATVAAGLTGCASQGPLQPPSLHLPANVQHLSAERFGDAVELHWTTPTRTTDGVSLTAGRHNGGPFTTEICRSATPFAAGPCSAITRMPAEAGKAGAFKDALVAPFSDGAPRLVHYRVRVLNAKGKGADGTDIAVVGGAALPAVSNLQAAPTPGGSITLRWKPEPSVHGDRILLHVTRGNEDHAETLAVESTGNDPGGANDAGARSGIAQSYSVFRTRTVSLDKQELTLNSAPAAVAVSATALPPPPAAPVGLEAVVNTLSAPEIDLVWQASDEMGVTGYVVYRSEDGGALIRITPKPIQAFSFSDTTVRSGIRYRYRVAGVNSGGVAGAMSAEIERAVTAP